MTSASERGLLSRPTAPGVLCLPHPMSRTFNAVSYRPSALALETPRRRPRQRADDGQAEHAFAQPRRRPVVQAGGEPAQVFGGGAPFGRGVARRERVLLDDLAVERDQLVKRLLLAGGGADAARDLGGVRRVVAGDFARERFGAQLIAEGSDSEVEPAQPRKLRGGDERPRARGVAEHDRRADRQGFERAPRLGEDEVVLPQNFLRLFEAAPALAARHV